MWSKFRANRSTPKTCQNVPKIVKIHQKMHKKCQKLSKNRADWKRYFFCSALLVERTGVDSKLGSAPIRSDFSIRSECLVAVCHLRSNHLTANVWAHHVLPLMNYFWIISVRHDLRSCVSKKGDKTHSKSLFMDEEVCFKMRWESQILPHKKALCFVCRFWKSIQSNEP